MAVRPTIYLKRPASQLLGMKEEMIPIDPSQGIGWLTEPWMKTDTDRLRRNANCFELARGTSLIDWGTDPEPLVRAWLEKYEIIQGILDTDNDNPASVQLSLEIKKAFSHIPNLITHLAKAQSASAQTCIESFGYDVMDAVTTAVTQLNSLATEAKQQADLATTMTDIVEGDDVHGLYEFVALSLAEAIVNGVHAVLSMQEYETELDVLIEEVGSNYTIWHRYVDASQHPEDLNQDLFWMSGSDTSFARRAQRLLLTPEAQSISALMLEARARLQAINDKLDRLKGDYDTARIMAEDVSTKKLLLEQWMRAYTNSRKIIEQFGGSKGRDVFAVMNGKLSQADYGQWGEIVTSEEWRSPHAANARIAEKNSALQAMLSCPPVLPPASQSIVDAAEEYLIRLERKLLEMKGTPDQAEDEDDNEDMLLLETTPSRTMTEEERVAEIYEMMVAVGAIKYCNKSHFTGGTPRAIFDVLVRIGKISKGEIQTKGQLLEKKMSDDGFLAPATSKRISVWESTAPGKGRWMRFVETRGAKKIPMTLHRLLRRHESEGKKLALKHGIAADTVVEAYEARRMEFQSRRDEYVESRKPGHGENDSD